MKTNRAVRKAIASPIRTTTGTPDPGLVNRRAAQADMRAKSNAVMKRQAAEKKAAAANKTAAKRKAK